jgi:molybdate transport system substrate-binding protein
MEGTVKKSISWIAIGFAAAMLSMQPRIVEAAEIKVLCAEAMKPVFEEIARDFERTSGNKVTATYSTAGVIAYRIRGGELTDGAIIPRAAFSPLVNEGKITSGSATRVAYSLLAVAVRAGAPKPDISTVEALKRTLLAAKSITYPDPTEGGAIGIQAASVIDRLGLTDQLKSKTTLTPAGEFRDILAMGQAELAIVQPVVVVNYPGIDLVGPLPAELQNTTSFDFMAGIGANAKESAAAKALILYLLSPAAARVIKAKGMEPG